MRPLILDEEAQARARKILAFAEEHHYRPGMTTPGDIPEHVGHFNSYRAVFSYTHSDGMVWAHLSVSVPGDKYPNPIAAEAIAGLFDLNIRECMVRVNEDEHCVVIARPLRVETMAGAH